MSSPKKLKETIDPVKILKRHPKFKKFSELADKKIKAIIKKHKNF